MSKYQLTTSECILRLSDGAFIPPDEGNTDYREYLAWVESGGVPAPAFIPVIEESVSTTVDPVTKLRDFLAANPDVASLLS